MENKDGKLEGFSIDLIEQIAEMLSFRYEVYLSPDGLYGGWNDETGYTGIVGEVTNNVRIKDNDKTLDIDKQQHTNFYKKVLFS